MKRVRTLLGSVVIGLGMLVAAPTATAAEPAEPSPRGPVTVTVGNWATNLAVRTSPNTYSEQHDTVHPGNNLDSICKLKSQQVSLWGRTTKQWVRVDYSPAHSHAYVWAGGLTNVRNVPTCW